MKQEEFVMSMAEGWGLSGEEKEIAIKKARIDDLFMGVMFPPMLIQFFDSDSDRLLDKKIEVLTALKEGKQISDILELYPKDGEHWD